MAILEDGKACLLKVKLGVEAALDSLDPSLRRVLRAKLQLLPVAVAQGLVVRVVLLMLVLVDHPCCECGIGS